MERREVIDSCALRFDQSLIVWIVIQIAKPTEKIATPMDEMSAM